jgi:hypothetical protein
MDHVIGAAGDDALRDPVDVPVEIDNRRRLSPRAPKCRDTVRRLMATSWLCSSKAIRAANHMR